MKFWRSGCAAALAALTLGRAENWPQFRGPRSDGTSLDNPGYDWKERWRTALPGPGHSSPAVWGDRVFVTAFEKDRSVVGAVLGRRGRLLVLCLNRADGSVRWQREAEAASIEKVSGVNQPASPTPATDGRAVYVYFGSIGVLAFDFEGRLLWRYEIGPYDHHMGSGASPVLAGGKLLLNAESDGPGFLICLDPRTGKALWRVPRRTKQAGYATVFVWRGMAVVPGHRQVTAYSLDDGRELWTVEGLGDYVVPTPVAGGDLLYVTSNGPGGGIVMALRAGGEVMWRSAKGGAYVASPVLAGGQIYTVHHGGVVTCLDAATGKLISQQRLEAGGDYYASPVSAGGLLYFVNEEGLVSVVDGGVRLVRREALGQRVYSSPAISDGAILFRTVEWLALYARP